MAGIQEFSQNTVLTNPKLPKDTLSSQQFNTLVEVVGEGEIEGSATASKAGLTKGTTAYNNAFQKDIFLGENFFCILAENQELHNKEIIRDIDSTYIQFHFVLRGSINFLFIICFDNFVCDTFRH